MMSHYYMTPVKMSKIYKGMSNQFWKCEKEEGNFYPNYNVIKMFWKDWKPYMDFLLKEERTKLMIYGFGD